MVKNKGSGANFQGSNLGASTGIYGGAYLINTVLERGERKIIKSRLVCVT